MSVDMLSAIKVISITEEFRKLCLEFENEDYPAINDRINHIIVGVNLLRQDSGLGRQSNIVSYREEYNEFINRVAQDENLMDYQKIVRYSNKIQGNLGLIGAQLEQRPHNVPKVDELSIGIIILLGDISTRWYM